MTCCDCCSRSSVANSRWMARKATAAAPTKSSTGMAELRNSRARRVWKSGGIGRRSRRAGGTASGGRGGQQAGQPVHEGEGVLGQGLGHVLDAAGLQGLVDVVLHGVGGDGDDG